VLDVDSAAFWVIMRASPAHISTMEARSSSLLWLPPAAALA
jgi:hypothetical protein